LIAKIIVRKRLQNVLEQRQMAHVLITNQMQKSGPTDLNPYNRIGLIVLKNSEIQISSFSGKSLSFQEVE